MSFARTWSHFHICLQRCCYVWYLLSGRLANKSSCWPCFRPWKTSKQDSPLQVPHSYKQNVCHYKDQFRYFYSAMVSALDHSVDQVWWYCWCKNLSFPDLTWFVSNVQHSKMRTEVVHELWSQKAHVCARGWTDSCILAKFTRISFLNRTLSMQLFLWIGMGTIWSPHSFF